MMVSSLGKGTFLPCNFEGNAVQFSNMNEYEITYLSDPQLTEDVRGELDAAVDSLVNTLGGSVSYAEPNNRRRLFYPIKKQTAGFARAMNITLDPSKIQELRQAVAKQAGVLRLYCLKTPRRTDIGAEILDEFYKRSMQTKSSPADKEKKEAKPVTMEEVEEKIEKALDEEVK